MGHVSRRKVNVPDDALEVATNENCLFFLVGPLVRTHDAVARSSNAKFSSSGLVRPLPPRSPPKIPPESNPETAFVTFVTEPRSPPTTEFIDEISLLTLQTVLLTVPTTPETKPVVACRLSISPVATPKTDFTSSLTILVKLPVILLLEMVAAIWFTSLFTSASVFPMDVATVSTTRRVTPSTFCTAATTTQTTVSTTTRTVSLATSPMIELPPHSPIVVKELRSETITCKTDSTIPLARPVTDRRTSLRSPMSPPRLGPPLAHVFPHGLIPYEKTSKGREHSVGGTVAGASVVNSATDNRNAE
ncbi:hypothetical protein Bhyg_14237 [Pseudolycoriella hygida]|uniref:Uncharacterized protein n=1 Tax=Pseudolycoriella hygida TaxID=35572 RepID=A0A9Q0RX33_9DIPT|nr:hypothetical protein Bhyg_14237 [Pseudolycoriella hygida]